MGGVIDKDESGASVPKTKLDSKIIEAVHKREAQGCSMVSFNSIILRFPKIDESFRKCRSTFEEFGKHSLRHSYFFPSNLSAFFLS